ncbi:MULTISPECIES: site-specific integrase [Pacificibacter]|uniref:site-specific integrase n=1 Tax=Pacificibacter TaxID=1042323 RepID=UPI001C08D3D3|nr:MULTISPECIES: site-specific integrase [Pacificibacter]MBU2935011.1 site-specific integrase [Pacificibacter marinus]MDO6617108.1 site-specific integrase [Pacificibacter sp. 1_MG-2023]
MFNQPHLSKRGNVYQWRRRFRRFSTGIVDIKLSLGTTDLRCAHILSRRISAESDIVMEQLTHQQITPEMARRWLASVITKEREKIEKLKLLHRFDSRDPADDNRHDQATADAWAQVNADGLHGATSDQPLVSLNLDIIRDDLSSEARQNIIQRDFKALTGHPRLSAFDRAKLISLLIAGKSAAWNRHEDALADIDTAADDLWDGASHLLASEPESPAAPLQLAPAPEVDTDTLDPDMMAVVSRMNEMKRSEGIEEKTLRQYVSFVGLFTTLTGISDVRLIRQTDATAFRAATREEIMARAEKLPPEKVGLSVGTINRHLEHLGQIVEWASDEGIAVNPNLKPRKLRRKDTVRDCDKKQAFTEAELRRLFKTPVWVGSKSEHYQTEHGSEIFRNGIYWSPLIGAFTGARREEVAGLAPTDIVERDGIPCFNIEDSELRRIKNISSKRIVPIHSRLIELGFLDFVSKARAKGQIDLFPDLREPATGKHGRKLGRRMRQIIDDDFGVEGAGLSFHSLRHYVQSILEHVPEVTDKVLRDVVGHEGKDTHERVYSKSTPPAVLQAAIERLPCVI